MPAVAMVNDDVPAIAPEFSDLMHRAGGQGPGDSLPEPQRDTERTEVTILRIAFDNDPSFSVIVEFW